MSYDDFKDIFMTTLNNHAPEKKKIVRGNQAPFMSHCLSKAIMHRSKLKNKFNKNHTGENKINYKKQRELLCKVIETRKEKVFTIILI